jgi:transketolase
VEAGVALGWHRWIAPRADVLALDRFGASAPGDRIMTELGFTADQVAERAVRLLA